MPTRLLVADDEQVIRRVLEMTFRRAGFEVTMAVDGLDALEKAAASPPDLVVLDVMMPRLDGLETLRRLRAEPALSAIPVILLTAKAQLGDRMAGFDRGADDYVAKPFEPAELVERIRALLKRTEASRLTRPLLDVLKTWGSEEGVAWLGRDLEAARAIQSRLLPDVPPVLAGLDAGAVLEPAAAVGGDFFDVIALGDRIAVAVGDVSGKGIAAALLMVMVRTLLREVARTAPGPAEALSRLNTSLCREMPPDMFVTLVIVALDPGQPGTLVVASGGHPPPVIIGLHTTTTVDARGPLVGAFTDVVFSERALTLEPGQALILYTDGVAEATDVAGHALGVDGLAALARAHAQLTAPALARAIADGIRRAEGRRVHDDLTLFVLRRQTATIAE